MFKRILRIFMVAFLAWAFITLFAEPSFAGAKSVWSHTNANTISTRDVMGNKMSVVCKNGTVTFYFSTKAGTFERHERSHVRLWADKDNKVDTRSRPVGHSVTKVRISDYAKYQSLINDMKNKYDLSVFMRTSSGSDIMLFALDGFSSKLRRVCGI